MLGVEVHLPHDTVMECRLLLTLLRYLSVFNDFHILVDVVQGLLLGKQGLEMAGTIFEDLNFSEVAVLLKSLAK